MLGTTLEQKEKIRQGIRLKKTYAELASELNMTKRTVKKWGQKIKRGDNLDPLIGRPPCGILGSFSPQISKLIDEYRPDEQGWGAKTIRVELDFEKKLKGEKKTFD